MDEKRQSRLEAAIIIAVALLPLWLLVAYVAGYYGFSTVSVTTPDPNAINSFPYRDPSVAVRRSFKYYWLAHLYQPAAAVETVRRGVSVSATVESRDLIIVD
jgi:hypothetical protein